MRHIFMNFLNICYITYFDLTSLQLRKLQTNETVQSIVGKTFDDKVLNSHKNVLLEVCVFLPSTSAHLITSKRKFLMFEKEKYVIMFLLYIIMHCYVRICLAYQTKYEI